MIRLAQSLQIAPVEIVSTLSHPHACWHDVVDLNRCTVPAHSTKRLLSPYSKPEPTPTCRIAQSLEWIVGSGRVVLALCFTFACASAHALTASAIVHRCSRHSRLIRKDGMRGLESRCELLLHTSERLNTKVETDVCHCYELLMRRNVPNIGARVIGQKSIHPSRSLRQHLYTSSSNLFFSLRVYIECENSARSRSECLTQNGCVKMGSS